MLNSNPQSKYRPDVDGLRAVAVLLVIFFHFDVEWFSGGYIGVDVFFVVSGFLISRLIKDEIEALGQGELSQLKSQVEEATAAGRDLLAEMAAQVNERIDEAKTRLESLLSR